MDKESDSDSTLDFDDEEIFTDKFNNITVSNKSSTDVGYQTELYVGTLLEKCSNISEYKNIGYFFNKKDFIYKIHGEDKLRGLQVKTLVQLKLKNTFIISLRKTYSADTLLVCCNKERTRFFIDFWKNINYTNINFTETNTFNNKDKLFFGEEKNVITGLTFLETLNEFCKFSDFYDENDIAPNNKSEQALCSHIEKNSKTI